VIKKGDGIKKNKKHTRAAEQMILTFTGFRGIGEGIWSIVSWILLIVFD